MESVKNTSSGLGGWVGTETQVVETLLMQRLDPTAVFLVLYSVTSAGSLLPQGPVTVISLHFPQSKVLLPQGVARAWAILIAHTILAMSP